MDFVMKAGSLLAGLAQHLALFGTWLMEVFRGTAWMSNWVQALCALAAIPITWLIASYSGRQASQAVMVQYFLDRRRESEKQDEEARALLFGRHCNLATQILFCSLRLRWAGESLQRLKDDSGPFQRAEDFQHLVCIVRHYAQAIQQLNMQDARHLRTARRTGPACGRSTTAELLLTGFRA
ncbi:MAG: hypothetical protein B7Z12_14345 [Caulobacter vibrioides]|uniref:Uncharacterized protein n=1 Tax=Caulobacter vibrioides TaxID=155892 RepID=A0A258D1Y0_CAUVI|nr:MAG: hypothetical protein B7Z12_14345 [Caulobacter vibrioides]